MNSFSTEPFKDVLIDKEERLDRSYMAVAINNRKISVLKVTLESIIQDLVISIILSLVGESRGPGRAFGQFGTGYNGNRERLTARAGSGGLNRPHPFAPRDSSQSDNSARCRFFPASSVSTRTCKREFSVLEFR